MAGAYVNRETPLVQVSRDFNLQELTGPQVQQYLNLWTNGAISHQTLLEVLQRGEILSEDMDIEGEIEIIEQDKLADLDLSAAGGNVAEEEIEASGDEPPDEEGGDSEIRQEVLKRLRRLAEDSESDEGTN
jgi:hypothetical protein